LVSELYDVVILPGVKRPMALGFKTDESESWAYPLPSYLSVVRRIVASP